MAKDKRIFASKDRRALAIFEPRKRSMFSVKYDEFDNAYWGYCIWEWHSAFVDAMDGSWEELDSIPAPALLPKEPRS
jgi:hypothetical protein